MKKIIIVSLLFISLNLFSKKITLDYLIQAGLNNSIEMKQEALNLKSDNIGLINSYLSLLPYGSVSASKSYYEDNESLISASFSLGQSVSWNDGRYFSIKNAIISKKSGELNYQDRKRNFIFSIFSKYIAIIKAQKNLEILQDNLNLQKKTFQQTKLKFEAGMISKLDFEQAKLSLISLQLELKKTKDNISNLRYDIFSFVGIQDDDSPFSDIDFSFIDNYSNAIKYENNSLKVAINDYKNARLSLLQQKLNLFPSLSLSFNYSYSSNPLYSFTETDKYTQSHSFGLSFGYGIFDIPSNHLNYSLAKRRLYLQKLRLDKQKKDLKNDIDNMKRDLEAFKETMDMEKQKLKISKENFQIAKEQYEAGFISLLDFDKARMDYLRSELSYNNSYYDLILKIGNLDLKMSNKLFNRW